MKHKPALFALLRLHAELGGRIKENKLQAKKLAADMVHVEAVLKMLEPGYNVQTISARRRRVPNRYIPRGEGFRRALSILREAERPLTSREIAQRLLASCGNENPTLKELCVMIGSVRHSLANHDGKLVMRHGEGMPVRWTLTP